MATVVLISPRDGGTYGTDANGNLVPFVATGVVDAPGQAVSLYEDGTGALLGSVNASTVPLASGAYAGWYAWSIPVSSWTGAAGATVPAAATTTGSGDAGLRGAVPTAAGAAAAAAGDVGLSTTVLGALPAVAVIAAAGGIARAAIRSASAASVSSSAGGAMLGASRTLIAAAWSATAGGIARAGAVTVPSASATSAGGGAEISFAVPDITAPAVTGFTVGTPNGLFVPIATFTASDAVGVTGYLVTTSSTPPLAGAGGWSGTAPASWTAPAAGTYDLYPWAKDAAGNVSAAFGTPRTVTVEMVVGALIPANGQFDSPLLGAPGTGGWWASDVVSGVAERYASASMTGSYVGRLEAHGYDEDDGEGGILSQVGVARLTTRLLTTPTKQLSPDGTDAPASGSAGTILKFDLRVATLIGVNNALRLHVYAYDAGGALISTTSGFRHQLVILGATLLQMDGTTLLVASPTPGTTYSALSFDVKAWLDEAGKSRLSGYFFDDVVARVDLAFEVRSGAGAGVSADLYLDNFRA